MRLAPKVAQIILHRNLTLAEPAPGTGTETDQNLYLTRNRNQIRNLYLNLNLITTWKGVNMNVIANTRRSRFLTKEEAGSGLTLTIDEVQKENVSSNGKREEKVVVYFQEANVKPLILNSANARAIAEITGTEESEEWRGKQIELYHDRTVAFGGQTIGGIRARAAKEEIDF
jgi:hypothetical protein